jgi:hypothetical protein
MQISDISSYSRAHDPSSYSQLIPHLRPSDQEISDISSYSRAHDPSSYSQLIPHLRPSDQDPTYRT